MSENKTTNNLSSSEYIHNMHKFGRWSSIISILVMMSMPIIAGLYFNAMPTFSAIVYASLPLLAIFIPTNIGEVIAYTPIAGSSIYLSFITGNLSNLKLPAASNALKIMDAAPGTEEADIFSGIAIGASTFVTIAIIALGMILMIPLQPVLLIPAVKTATSYIMPALFGTLVVSLMSPNIGGGIRAPRKLFGAIIPAVALFIFVAWDKYMYAPAHAGKTLMAYYQGVVVVVLLIVLYFSTKLFYDKGIIKVYLKGENIPSKK